MKDLFGVKKIIISCSMLGIASSAQADVDWTGGSGMAMYSNVKVTAVHSGYFDGRKYFCIKTKKTDFDFQACAVSGYSTGGPEYEQLYNQAMYFYSTGENVRIYTKPNVWTNSNFVSKLTSNALTGFSTCESDISCYGPDLTAQ